jgi:hypothetical protein
MHLTREEIISKVNSNDKNWFYSLYNGDCAREAREEFKIVYNQHYGDGNDWTIAFSFFNFNLFVVLEGSYSSWDSPYWDKVSFAVPYEYKETRYRATKLEDIRDMRIDSVLNNEENLD